MANLEPANEEKICFDVIVVGAGLSGCAAAAVAARGGLKVALVERGQSAGSKNLFGGTVYTHSLEEVYPDVWTRKPPMERPVTEAGFWFLSKDSMVRMTTQGGQLAQKPADAYITQMTKFNAWWAEQAVKEGVFIIPKTTVVDFTRDENGRVNGVRTDRPQGDIYAPVVIVCEGINNILTQKLGLIRHDLKPGTVALGVKQLIALPTEQINARFGLLDNDHGLAVSVLGDISMGMTGMGFIYTGQESLAVGLGINLDQLEKYQVKPYEVLQRFLKHPSIAPLVAGGRLMEYGAHLIPEGGYTNMPALFSDGVMVAGDAATMVNALHWEGTNMAIVAGKAAAETALEAFRRKDFTASTLSLYREKLQKRFVLQDLYQYRKLSHFLESHPDFMDVYPNFLTGALDQFMSGFGKPKKQLYTDIFKSLTTRKPLLRAVGDVVSLGRAVMGW